jgi:hypothetical protein
LLDHTAPICTIQHTVLDRTASFGSSALAAHCHKASTSDGSLAARTWYTTALSRRQKSSAREGRE